MPPKQTYQNNGKPVTGEPVKVEHTSEPWAEYTLADGSKIKAKLVLLEAVRLDDFHPATGDPIYQLQFQNIMGITVPQELKKIVDPNTPGKPVQ